MSDTLSLRDFRLAAGLTQEALAERMGTSAVYISQVETGFRRPSVDWLRRLAAALRVDLAALFGALGYADSAPSAEAEIAALVAAHPDLEAVFALAREHPGILPHLVRYAKYLVSELDDEQGEITSATDWPTRG